MSTTADVLYPHWQFLTDLPQTLTTHSKILVLNDDEILAYYGDSAGTWTTKYPFCKYKISKNEWIEWFSLKALNCSYATCAFNHDKSKLYMFGDPGYIHKIDLETKEYTTSQQKYHDGSHSRSLFVNGQYHIFGGWGDEYKSHYIWNEEEQDLMEICKFDASMIRGRLTAHSIFYLSSKQSILVIPRYDAGNIALYSLATNKYDELHYEAKERNTICSVLTEDERYVICFTSKGIQFIREIFILDLNTMRFGKSKIESPKARSVCIINDNYKREMCVFGYIRKCWNLPEFSGIDEAPNDIVMLIKSFVSFEMIYVLTPREFMCISVDDILQRNEGTAI